MITPLLADRLFLREFLDADFDALGALNTEPAVQR
jgi:hypothetical protein